MIELRDYQKKAVRELKQKMIDMLNDSEDRQKLIFKAPTGAGKTVMVSTLLDELTRDLPMNGQCRYSRVAWVWIAPNKLHQQSYRSMRNFFSERRSLRPVMFDECDHVDGLHPGDVLFLNWESINKDNAVMIRDNEQNRTLYELIRKTKIEQHLPVVVIIDEEHMFAGRNAKKSEMVLQAIQPHIELRVSATPVTQSYHAVLVKRQDVINEEMIKKGIELNPNVRSSKEQSELTVNQRLLKKALEKRKELAEAYKEYGINPLLLIQLPNDSCESMSSKDKTIAEEMQAYLEQVCDISVANGRLAVWLSKDKSPNLQNITHSDDITEVLLFKQAIALGWDCPRASVLLIFRELQSMTFTTQTVGRILRMPEQHFYKNDILNYGYVYTDLAADMINIVGDDMNYISTLYANRKKDLPNITLRSYYTDKHGATRNRLGSQFRSIFYKTMEREWEQNPLLLFSAEDFFEDDGETEDADEAKKKEADMDAKIFNHALYPYFEQITASRPEQEFARWLDDKMEYVEWWYKNGDEGKQHFAVPYTDSGSRKRCFYVDFIVRLKSGTICLFDTKTKGSDADAPEKNNALLDYISSYQATGKKIVGGVLIKDEGTSNWYYPGGVIENTDNIDGWSALHLEAL